MRGGTDISYLHGVRNGVEPKNGYLLSEQYTLIKNLDLAEEDLFLTLGKHLRSHIKRSMKDENVNIRFYTARDVEKEPNILTDCQSLYEKMYRDKGMTTKFNMNLAKAYLKQDALCIGMAYLNGHAVGFSGFVYDEQSARLWIAAFDFRNNEKDLSQILSRAHKRLDWEMLLWCKAHGVKEMDFGGVRDFDGTDGISKFKLEFAQENKVIYHNYLVPGSFLGKMIIFLYKRKNR